MQPNFRQRKRVAMSGLIVVALLIPICTNVSEATIGTGTQVVQILPISSGSTAEPIRDSGVNFILELVPLGYLFSPDADGFEVYSSGSGWSDSEEMVGYGSWLPSARAGVRINAPMVGIDITGGGGYLWNGAVNGPFVMADCAANFHVGKNTTLGPHVGIVSFGDLEWFGDADVDLTGSTGLMAGFVLNTGGKRAGLYLSVDYIEAKFDVETGSGWTANDDTLDMSGVGVQAGLILRF
jgi:hypothetical protein